MGGEESRERDTGYATLLAEGRIDFRDGNSIRIERLYVKEQKQDEIRFSWWKHERLIPRPLDVSEKQLLSLFQKSIKNAVFTRSFISRLKIMLEDYILRTCFVKGEK